MKPKDLLHELEQGERIGEDIKKFLMQMNSPSRTTATAWSTYINDDFVDSSSIGSSFVPGVAIRTTSI